MAPLDRSFDARNQNDAAFGRVRSQPLQTELPLVEGDGKRAVSELRRSINQLDTGIWDPIDWIVRGVGVELDFQHRQSILDRACVFPEQMSRRRRAGSCGIGTFFTPCSKDDTR